jgi:succinate dehydrogenase flavin-adding protein (antitoxin of CptAB toxin-antitoxin module)
VSKRLGHATITQTLETYAHLMQDTDEKMMKIIENESKLSPKQ